MFLLSLTGWASSTNDTEHWEKSTQKNKEINKIKRTDSYVSTWDKQWPTGVYGQHGDHAVTSPWTEICGTHLSAVVWQSRLLSLHLPWHNQQKLWLVGPPVTYTDKLQQPIRAQEGMPGSCMRTLRKMRFAVFGFWPFPILRIGLFWVNVSIAGWVKHMKGGLLPWACGRRFTCSNFQPSDMVDTICVSSSSWHCSTRYTCFTGTCEEGWAHEGKGMERER